MMHPIAEAHGDDIMVLHELFVGYLTQGFIIDEEGRRTDPQSNPRSLSRTTSNRTS